MSTHSHRFPRDPGLSFRMVLVMFLLGLLYVVFISVLLAAKVQTSFVIILAVALLFSQYYFSDRIALFAMHAKEVTPQQQPMLHGIVDRLCALADMPKPRVAIADSDMPNAFATGRNQKNAVVCATTGLMRRLDEQELEAVIAHELSHVAHRDVAVMTIASGLGMIAGLITRFTLYSGMYGGGYGRGRDRDGQSPILVIILVSVIVYAVSFLLIRALSRYRELAADRGGAAITGAPSRLASALVKVSGEIGRIPTRDLRAAEPFNAFFFAPALASGFSLSTLFSTHPSLQQRLDQLARIEDELGKRA